MDRSQFGITLGSSAGVSLEQTARQLLPGTIDDLLEEIDAELYKLNVYGKYFVPNWNSYRRY
jgi:hypothetical protein